VSTPHQLVLGNLIAGIGQLLENEADLVGDPKSELLYSVLVV
jgi:hypothetical protein